MVDGGGRVEPDHQGSAEVPLLPEDEDDILIGAQLGVLDTFEGCCAVERSECLPMHAQRTTCRAPPALRGTQPHGLQAHTRSAQRPRPLMPRRRRG